MDMYVPTGFRGDDGDYDSENYESRLAYMADQSPVDAVNHPPHYTFGKFEVIDVLEDWFPTDPLLWQVGKYIARAGHKGNRLQDLEKAHCYLERAISKLKAEDAS